MKAGFRPIPALSLTLCVLVGIASLGGLSAHGIYSHETPNWQLQTLAQDFVNLAIALPVLAASVIMMLKRHKAGLYLAAGTTAFLAYTYAIYCFSIHFNIFFIDYCAIFGISLFSLAITYRIARSDKASYDYHAAGKTIGIYFIVVAVAFFFLWMAEIIPPILHRTVPASLAEVGLPTNPIHVLDLSVCLPLIFMSGIMVLRKKEAGRYLIPVVLTFFTLMDISIAILSLMMVQNGFGESYAVAGIMFGLALFSLGLLLIHANRKKQAPVYA